MKMANKLSNCYAKLMSGDNFPYLLACFEPHGNISVRSVSSTKLLRKLDIDLNRSIISEMIWVKLVTSSGVGQDCPLFPFLVDFVMEMTLSSEFEGFIFH
ncbi:Ubiquinol-cytochrome-c reductase complex assembly factor 1 [Schistosoma haematobium]|uniref:Ubiquinol-cytochrome-c reductase complex assembly factor 1 n=1 Tax=Schistosoma haematobium TaxID=6185 RepID=A0A922LKB2_SCHHA|nr:Ubiquinol-cytochrome-c reductase complex assembly factor 1 [Schistosoma haematobium]KAH9587820.1 Ubiquinol-cytochrome-c reductase complex assembly factor 1 [Schistosoma haematobium]